MLEYLCSCLIFCSLSHIIKYYSETMKLALGYSSCCCSHFSLFLFDR